MSTRRPFANTPRVAILPLMGLALALPAHAQVEIQWNKRVDEVFDIPTNWDPPIVPTSGNTAVFAQPGDYDVLLTQTREVGAFDFVNRSANLVIAGGRGLTTSQILGGGRITVNDAGTTFSSELFLDAGTLAITNIALNGAPGEPTSRARLRRPSSGDNAIVDGTVSGRGDVIGGFDFRGDIDARGIDGFIQFITGASTLASDSFVRSDAGAGIGLSSATFTGGTWSGGDGALLDVSGSTIADAAIEGRWLLDSASALTLAGDIAGGFMDDGLIVVNDDQIVQTTDLNLAAGADVATDVLLNTGPGLAFGSARLLGAGSGADAPILRGELAGRGRLSGAIELAGLVSPGSTAGDVDELELASGTVTLTPSATLAIDIAGPVSPDDLDRLAGGGSITLGGTLVVDFADGFVPGPSDSYEIIDLFAVDGEFDTVDIEPVGAAASARVMNTDRTDAIVLCGDDLDGDGDLTIFDFLTFQNLFDMMDPRADFDGDGAFTIFDFLSFQNAFGAGCP
ncbi:MAG: GC-type dockerin domain-anchored protein [Phycisphaerales bacterium JB060]